MTVRCLHRARIQVPHRSIRSSNHLRILQFSTTAPSNDKASPVSADPYPQKQQFPYPTTATCPPPTCVCAAAPRELDIDRTKQLKNTIAAYSQHVVLCTGNAEWPTRLQGSNTTMGRMMDEIKESAIAAFTGKNTSKNKHGKIIRMSSVRLNAASFAPSPPPYPVDEFYQKRTTSVYLFPSFQYIPQLVCYGRPLEAFSAAYLASSAPSSSSSLSQSPYSSLTSDPTEESTTTAPHLPVELEPFVPRARPVTEIVVMICGHASRDKRCGIMGPLLEKEFKDKLARVGFELLEQNDTISGPCHNRKTSSGREARPTARVGLISHVGGHAFAGNVIIYIPPGFKGTETRKRDLAGVGLWYGRVEPGHVEGIVAETIIGGKVVRELFRGMMGREGDMVALP